MRTIHMGSLDELRAEHRRERRERLIGRIVEVNRLTGAMAATGMLSLGAWALMCGGLR